MLMRHDSGASPAVILRLESDLPLVEIGPGVALQLLQVDFDHNIQVTRARLAPGCWLRTHIHARAYLNACKERGLPRPDVIGLAAAWEG